MIYHELEDNAEFKNIFIIHFVYELDTLEEEFRIHLFDLYFSVLSTLGIR